MPASIDPHTEPDRAPSAPDTALLLVNLGTPDAPTPGAVRRYLREFLSDRRVVQIPPLLWQPLLRGLILPLRSARVARKYAGIWLDGGSPLAVYTARLAEAVQQRLPRTRVLPAMRYGEPSLRAALRSLREEGVARVLVLPLYPQYSTTTTASVRDVVDELGIRGVSTLAAADAALSKASSPPSATPDRQPISARLLEDYHLDPDWIAAVAGSIRAHWNAHGRGERLLLSFHGIPQRLVDAGDPYARQCEASTAAIAQALGLARGEVMLTFQSRFGREAWLQPYTQPTLEALARAGVRRVDIACPGFAVDCLETLEEIAIENAEAFREAGGTDLRYIPCLNDAPAHADALAAIAQRALDAWRLGA
jgi:protoporphyrin/coproporphyrin ferrochelatase